MKDDLVRGLLKAREVQVNATLEIKDLEARVAKRDADMIEALRVAMCLGLDKGTGNGTAFAVLDKLRIAGWTVVRMDGMEWMTDAG